MRCKVCDMPLTDYETKLRRAYDGAYMDTCMRCIGVFIGLEDEYETKDEDITEYQWWWVDDDDTDDRY